MANNIKLKPNVWLDCIPTLSSQNVNTNKSKIRVRGKLANPYGTYRYAGSGDGWRIKYLIKHGSTQLYDTGWIDYDYQIGTIYPIDKEFEIAHNAEGKLLNKTFSIAVYGQANQGLASTSGHTASVDLEVPTIPRASTFEVTGDTIGSPINVAITRASSSFTHKVLYKLPGKNFLQVSSSAATSASFTVPMTSCSIFPNTIEGEMTVEVETYRGSTFIGRIRKDVPIKVPVSVVPTISTTISTEGPNSFLMQPGGYFIQSKQWAHFQHQTQGALGSSVKTITTKVEGISYVGADVTTSPLMVIGDTSAVITVEDSRGRKTTIQKIYTVYPFEPLKVNYFRAARCNQDGTINAMGAYAKVEYSVLIPQPIPGSVHRRIIVRHRKRGTEAWTKLYTEPGGGSIHSQVYPFSINEGHELWLEAQGFFNQEDHYVNLNAGMYPITWNTDGQFRVGIGMPTLYPGINFPEMPKVNGVPLFEGIYIPAGSDLNTYITPGIYYNPLNDEVATISNTPINKAFNLQVLKHTKGGGVRQIFREYRTLEPRTYERNFYQTWGAWVEVLTTHNAKDHVIEQGAHYVKWASGRMEQTATVATSVSFQEWGAIHRTNAINAPNFVHSFVGKFAVYHSIEFATGWCGIFIIHPANQRNAGGVALWRPVATSGTYEVTVIFKAEGRWK